ncbi:MAG: hypothetical protein IT249_01040 [Chitinophagaceae bacterium]|nr:hypothetical protein [Chitinophagaceae bacterium]
MRFSFLFAMAFVFITGLSGCATYSVTTQSLAGQFANVGIEKKEAPFFFYKAVYGNQLTEIRCLDKKGNEKTLPVTNHTGIRITKADNSKVTFYFDTLILQDSSITGSKSHFFKAPVKIYFNEITKIELQK